MKEQSSEQYINRTLYEVEGDDWCTDVEEISGFSLSSSKFGKAPCDSSARNSASLRPKFSRTEAYALLVQDIIRPVNNER
jgi:hypothetical protein